VEQGGDVGDALFRRSSGDNGGTDAAAEKATSAAPAMGNGWSRVCLRARWCAAYWRNGRARARRIEGRLCCAELAAKERSGDDERPPHAGGGAHRSPKSPCMSDAGVEQLGRMTTGTIAAKGRVASSMDSGVVGCP
jgi:hypothetical protein